MKRLVILRSNPIDPDPRVEKIARSLTRAGWQVTVLGWNKGGDAPPDEIQDGYRLIRLPIRARFGRGLANLGHELRWQLGLFSWLLRRRREYDCLHACDFDTILPALICQILGRKKVVYDIFDFYADMLRNTSSWLISVIRRIDLWAIGRADAVIIADESRISQIAGSKPKRLEVIYNSPEEISLPAGDGSNRRAAESLRVAYVGLLQAERGLFVLLDVLERHPEWSLDLAGAGAEQPELLERIRSLPNVSWHGRVVYADALRINDGADVLCALYDPVIPNHKYASPNKIFEAMLLSKPVLVAYGTNTDRIVATADCGVIVEYGELDSLESALGRLAADPRLRAELGSQGRRAYDATFAWSLMEKRLRSLYQAVCG